MKSSTKLLASLFALGICVNVIAQTTTTSPAHQFSESQILQTWGWMLAHQRNVNDIEISDTELATFLKGVSEGYRGQPCPYFYFRIIPDVKKLAKTRRAKYVQAVTDQHRAEAQAFFAQLDQDPSVVKLPSGLRYKIIRPGSGPCAKPQQTVNVHFLGHLLDGQEFTQYGPVDTVLWNNRFNQYLYEAIQKLSKGGLMRVYVANPPTEMELAMYGIPPGSAMIYEVELLDIKETAPDELAMTLAPPAPLPPPDPPSGYSDQQIMETWGWFTVRRTVISKIGLDETQLAAITNGLVAGIHGQPPPYDLDQIGPEIDTFVEARLAKAQEAFKEKQLAARDAFFAELKKNPKIVQSPTGLFYQIINPGSGPSPKPGKSVKISYVGTLIDGKVFDHTEGGDTHTIALRNPRGAWPIAGWYEGLQKISKGGEIKLYIPPSLGYGDDAYNGAPPFSTLIFDITLVDVTDTPP